MQLVKHYQIWHKTNKKWTKTAIPMQALWTYIYGEGTIMTGNREHCSHTLELFGVTGKDIHRWMDAPAKEFGQGHRKTRHNADLEIPQVFIDRYGDELARKIVLDHIKLDNRHKDNSIIPKRLSCQNCGYEWNYKGKAYRYTSCPTCLYRVNIKKRRIGDLNGN